MALNHIQYRNQKQFQFVHSFIRSSFIRSFVHRSFVHSFISKCHPLHLRLLLPLPLPTCLPHSSVNLGIPQVRRIWNWNSNCAEEK